MLKPKTILTLGIWLILIPFFGVPAVWRTFLLYATGFILIANYFLRKKEEPVNSAPSVENDQQ
ncbi:MAG TPA: hypothetical protein VJC04_00400 [Candidatus Paceibacterota bacterium]